MTFLAVPVPAPDFPRLAGEFPGAVRAAGLTDAAHFGLHGAMAADSEDDPKGNLAVVVADGDAGLVRRERVRQRAFGRIYAWVSFGYRRSHTLGKEGRCRLPTSPPAR